ncbi:Cytochrome oxidase assembly [Coemansia spiralis]|nr:Cytochrome oxidase assembly [Coemansia spiralis]
MHREIPSSQWVRKNRTSRMGRLANKYPFLCVGLPFLVAVVGGTFVLLPMQQTKYEIHDQRNRLASVQEAQGKQRKLTIQEEYFQMQTAGTWGEWEPKRVERPPEEEPVFDRHGKK